MRAKIKTVTKRECVLDIEPQYAEKLYELLGKECEVEIEEVGNKWSDRARRYAWKLNDEIAKSLHIKRYDMHFQSLKDYAPSYILTIRSGEDPKDYTDSEYYEEERTVGDYVQYIVYKGFKNMNSKQLGYVISGLEQDAREQGIPTKSDEELEHILKEWRSEEKT